MAGSRANILNYEVSYKISICEEYYEKLKNNQNLAKKEFANDKGIKYTTFLDWLNKYQHYQDNIQNNNVITVKNDSDIKTCKFVEISKDDILQETINKDNIANKVILKYKDVSLEFDNDDNCLEKVLEIIRRW